jgi:hypothetical protein
MRMKGRSFRISGFLFAAFMLISTAAMGVPRILNFQGVALDGSLNPITGTHDLTFRIYPDTTGSPALWVEVHTSVYIEDGLINEVLGELVAIPDDLFENDERWLRVMVDSDPEMPPVRITSVPWAFRALIADSAKAAPSGACHWSANGSDIYYNDGNVGIGTDAPEALFHVQTGNVSEVKAVVIDSDGEDTDTPFRIRGNTNGTGYTDADTKFRVTGDGRVYLPNTMLRDDDSFGGRLQVIPYGNRMILWDNVNSMRLEVYHGNNDLDIALRAGGSTSWINGVNDGNVGIGTQSPQEQLDVDGAIRLGTTAGTNSGTMRWTGSDFEGYDGSMWRSFTGGSDADWTIAGIDMYSSVTGNVGIGTTTPHAKLTAVAMVTDTALYGQTYNGTAIVGSATTGTSAGRGVVGMHGGGNYGVLGSGDYSVYGYGDAKFTNGTTEVDVLEITGGSDLSENFDILGTDPDLELLPGMVVSIDPENPGCLAVSAEAYDRKVAGIVSGAGGIRPGMLMGQEGSVADGSNPVALTGRVYCLVDASYGEIQPGDLLTTSDTPGYAMKVSDHSRAHGAILGKAMSSLGQGRGLVLVLVTLQ